MGISATIASIGDAIAAAGATAGGLATSGLGALGVGADTAGLVGGALGTGLTGAGDLGLIGGGLGAGEGLLTGKNPLKTGLSGLEAGSAIGFGGGLGGALGGAAGIGTGLGGALGGAGFGAGESAASGGSPLTGAFSGAIGGYGASSLGSGAPVGTASPGGVASATSGSLSGSGGASPAGSLGSDLTGATVSTPSVTSSFLPGVGGGGSTIAGGAIPSLGGGGGNASSILGGANVTPPSSAGLAGISAPAEPDLAAGGGTGLGTQVDNIFSKLSGGVDNIFSKLSGGNDVATQGGTFSATRDPVFDTGNGLLDTGGPQAGNIGQQVGQLLGLGQGGQQFLGKYGGDILQGGLLANNALSQQSQLKSLLGPLQASAGQLSQQSAALEGGLFGGQLPAGAKAAVDQATQSAKANIRSTYANLGLAGSTMEADALNQADQQAAAQTFQMANTLFAEGQKGTQMSDDLYQNIISAQLTQDKGLQDAISNFAAQMVGSQIPSAGKSITLNLAGGT